MTAGGRGSGALPEERPVVFISVHPALLESTLRRLLVARGWRVADPSGPVEARERLAAAVVSQERVGDLGEAAEVTLVLPDEAGRGGSLRRRGSPSEPLPARLADLEEILEVLPAVEVTWEEEERPGQQEPPSSE